MTMRDTDRALVQAASAVAKLRCRSAAHTVAAAARTTDGRVVSGVDVVHDSAGACAEVIVVGSAATQGVQDLETIVTVGDRGRSLLTPCGSCQRLLADRFPALRVIVGPLGDPRVVPVAELPTAHHPT
ncbi:cytidine/deoxycytidylate deaminase family protein [Micromonospora radicis]|uniref:Cytidine deaminase n=1 Tax=Micromonospora radicis TaxID=1894971 RepID=A0A418MXN1_9ACTN|nr:cytidine deaminase [Micromonospora radicis]RIV39624.1 cytidine deaminase [Micromonospora radicis]